MEGSPGRIRLEYRDGLVLPNGNCYMFDRVDGVMEKIEPKPLPEVTAEEVELYRRIDEEDRQARKDRKAKAGEGNDTVELHSDKWWRIIANGKMR